VLLRKPGGRILLRERTWSGVTKSRGNQLTTIRTVVLYRRTDINALCALSRDKVEANTALLVQVAQSHSVRALSNRPCLKRAPPKTAITRRCNNALWRVCALTAGGFWTRDLIPSRPAVWHRGAPPALPLTACLISVGGDYYVPSSCVSSSRLREAAVFLDKTTRPAVSGDRGGRRREAVREYAVRDKPVVRVCPTSCRGANHLSPSAR